LIDAMAGAKKDEAVGAEHYRTMACLVEGLTKLVELRTAEDRHWRRVRARRVRELTDATS
jgi:hypothetical protein